MRCAIEWLTIKHPARKGTLPIVIHTSVTTSPPGGVLYCISACLSVCSYISKTVCANFMKLSIHFNCDCGWTAWSNDHAVLYVLPVLWMTACLRNRANTDNAWSLRHSKLFTVTRQVAPLNCASVGEVCCRRLPC